MTDLTYSTLEFIAMSKKEGILQLDLTKLIPSETSKTIFFHIKKLEILGLIKRKATDNNGIRTNRIYLSRFAPFDVEKTEYEENESDQNIPTKTCPLYIELPFDHQIYNIIESNGASGVYQKDIRFKQLAYKDTVKLLEKVISKRNLVISYPENVGRTVTYKLVAKYLPDGMDVHRSEDINELMNINKSLMDAQAIIKEQTQDEEKKDTPTKVKKPSKKTIQFVKRKRLLVDELKKNNIIPLVKIRRIFEMNQNNEQEKYLNSLNDDLKTVLDVDALKKQYTIDKKTIKSVIDELVKEKLAQLTTVLIPMSSGITKNLKLLISPTATETQINDYISSLRESDLNKIVVTSGTGYSKTSDSNGDVSNIVKQESTEQPQKPIETNYFVSLKYGFIRAKMQRVKLLHQFIWMKIHGIEYNISSAFQNEAYVKMSSSAKKFIQEFRGNTLSAPIEPMIIEPKEVNPEFTLIDIIMDMPLELYCQVIGQPTEIENLMQYKHKTIRELPQNIQAIICERRLFMKRAQILIDIMLKLSLIRKIIIIDYNNSSEGSKQEVKFSGHDYTLCNAASIKDINDENQPTKEFTFNSIDDLNNYWNYLETVCLNSAETLTVDQEDDSSTTEEYFPKECFVKTNWLGSSNLRKYQKKILYDSMQIIKLEREQYPNGITPSMEILARKTHLSPHQVSIWYMKQFNRSDRKRKRTSSEKTKKGLKKIKKQEEPESFNNKPENDLTVPYILPDELTAPRLPNIPLENRQEEKVEDEEEEIDDIQTQFTRALPNRKAVQVNTGKIWESSSSSVEKFEMPSSIEEFHSMYSFTEDNLPINDTKLCSASSTTNHYKEIETPSYDVALLDYIVTILMVPEKDYQMEKAYKLFGHFFEHEFAECFEVLRKNGIITKDRVGSRGYQLTIKYKNLLKHFSKQLLMNLKKADLKYSEELNKPHQPFYFKPEDQQGGIIAYLLSKYINSEIDLDIEVCKNNSEIVDDYDSNKKSKNNDNERTIPEVSVKIEPLNNHMIQIKEDPEGSKPKTFSVITWKDIENELKDENDETVKLYNDVYNFIKGKEEKGARLSELYYNYTQNIDNVEYDTVMLNLEKSIKFLEKSNIITKISLYYDDAWISTEYTDRWSVTKGETNEKVIFYPWISLNGEVDKKTLNRIKLAMCYIIYNKPGITYNQLLHEHSIFRPSVMMKILEMLEKDGLIRYEYNSYRKPCFNTIFEENRDNIVSHYTKEDFIKRTFLDNYDRSLIYDFSILPNPDILLKLPFQE